MTFVPAVTKAIFPDTLKDGYSILKTNVYKDDIGRRSDFSVAAPFSFKTEMMGAFSAGSLDDRSYNNGFEKAFGESESTVLDMCEDLNYIYYLYLYVAMPAGTPNYYMYVSKITKSTIFDDTPEEDILDLAVTTTILITYNALHNSHMVLAGSYLYVAVNWMPIEKMKICQVKISDMSLEAATTVDWDSTITGDPADTWEIMDVCTDYVAAAPGDSYLYVCGRYYSTDSGAPVYESWIAAYDLETLIAVSVITSYASTVYAYNFASMSVKEKGLLVMSGIDASATGVSVVSFDGTAFTFESNCSIDDSVDSAKHLCDRIDRVTQPEVSIVGYDESVLLNYRNSGGAIGDGAGTYTIDVPDQVNGVDFIVRLICNYGSGASNSQPLFRVMAAPAAIIYPLNIYITNAGILTIDMYDGTAVRTVATAPVGHVFAAYETIALDVVRRSGVFTISVNGVSLVVAPTAFVNTFLDYSDTYVTGGWGSEVDFCYESMYLNINGTILVNLNFSNGVSTSADVVGFTYVKAVYYSFVNINATYLRRFSMRDGVLSFAKYDAVGRLYLASVDYGFTSTSLSYDLSGEFRTPGDTALYALQNTISGSFFILTNMNYDGKYVFQISQIHLRNSALYYFFTFAPNAREVEVKFSPTVAGYFTDNLEIKDVDDEYTMYFLCVGTCYDQLEEPTLDITDCIIKMNEGHKDYLRYTPDDLDNVVIPTYGRAPEFYKGTVYAYSSELATFVANENGLYARTSITVSRQNLANIYDAWFDTVNIYYDLSDGKAVENIALAVYIVAAPTATRATVQTALDSNYSFNTSVEPVKFSEDENTGLIANTVVSAKKETEVYAVRSLNNRDHYAIRFRIKCKTDGYFDDFKVREIRYSPSGAFYIGGSDGEN